jgi:hypothetical protein
VIGNSLVRHECRSVNRNCCLGIWNLYFVFQFPNRRARRVIWILHGDIWILKSVQVPKSAARRGIWILDGLSRFLETVQFSKIRGEAWNLESASRSPRTNKSSVCFVNTSQRTSPQPSVNTSTAEYSLARATQFRYSGPLLAHTQLHTPHRVIPSDELECGGLIEHVYN